MENAPNTTANLRATLATAMDRAINGELTPDDGRNIIGLANQISQSMSVEVKVMKLKMSAGHAAEKFGELQVF